MKISKKGFLQISFAWLFAIIVGAMILFFAIYASVKLINTGGETEATVAGKEISVLLNPLETGFGEETTTSLTIAVESRINNECNVYGDFGSQEISVSQMSRGEWTASGLSQQFYNKYIFSRESPEGRTFYLFSKPLNMPFKVADLIFLTSANDAYCFANAPDYVTKELGDLSQGNLFTDNCPEESINVCFNSAGAECDIIVDENQGSVKYAGNRAGDGEIVYYETDALMYAAIFSEPDSEMYECQIKRLMKRLDALALVYHDKESILSRAGCSSEINLLGLADSASSLRDSSDLIIVKAFAENAKQENKRAYCELW